MHAGVGNKGLRHVKSAITPRKKKLKCDSWHNTYLEERHLIITKALEVRLAPEGTLYETPHICPAFSILTLFFLSLIYL